MDDIKLGFVSALLWSSREDFDGLNYRNFTESAREKVEGVIGAFLANDYVRRNIDNIKYGDHEFSDYELIGHDLALSVNGHGSGFFARSELGGMGDRLQRIAESIGEVNIYRLGDSVYV